MCSDREITQSNKALGNFFDQLEGELAGDAKVSAKKLRAAADSFAEARVSWGQYTEGWGGTEALQGLGAQVDRVSRRLG